jgi:hypothetical protein
MAKNPRAQRPIWNLRTLSDQVVETVVALFTKTPFCLAPVLLVIVAAFRLTGEFMSVPVA